jgi:hypothetical protein
VGMYLFLASAATASEFSLFMFSDAEHILLNTKNCNTQKSPFVKFFVQYETDNMYM